MLNRDSESLLFANVVNPFGLFGVKNSDDACFAWAVVSALYPIECPNSYRTSLYPHYTTVLQLEGVKFPMKQLDIRVFEELNNLSINVYGLEGNSIIGPLHFTSFRKEIHVNLLYLEDGEKTYYSWIRNLSRLVSSQLSKHEKRKYLCDGCLLYFSCQSKLDEHLEQDCNKIRTILPTPDNNILKFLNYNKQMRVPFIIYADFESVLKPISTCSPNPADSYIKTIHQHLAHSFA